MTETTEETLAQTWLRENTDKIVGLMKQTKEGYVGDDRTDPDDTDLNGYVHVFRGDSPVLAVIAKSGERDDLLQIVHRLVYGTSADYVVLTFEAWHTSHEKNPLTGEDWQTHDMSYLAAMEDGVAKGWVKGTLTHMGINRELDNTFVSYPYDIDGHTVTWDNEVRFYSWSDEGKNDGYVLDVLKEVMKETPLHQVIDQRIAQGLPKEIQDMMGDLANSIEPERRQFHEDMATVKFLAEQGLAMAANFFSEPGTLREKLITEAYGAEPNKGPVLYEG